MKTLIAFSLSSLICLFGFSQDFIELRNSSFEKVSLSLDGIPNCCNGASSWYSCGKPDLNTPDAQPGNFGVIKPAKSGEYYLAMVVRDNDSWESISQPLEKELKAKQEYWISVALAKSENLISQSRLLDQEVNYNKSTKLRIWGGDGNCHKSQLLVESSPVDHTEWVNYEFLFTPNKNFKYQ